MGLMERIKSVLPKYETELDLSEKSSMELVYLKVQTKKVLDQELVAEETILKSLLNQPKSTSLVEQKKLEDKYIECICAIHGYVKATNQILCVYQKRECELD